MFPQKQQGDSWSQSQMVCLLMGCVCSLPRSVSLNLITQFCLILKKHSFSYWSCILSAVCVIQVEVPQIDHLLSELEEMSCTCSHPLSYTSAAKCFAGLVNKRPQGQFVSLLSPSGFCSKTESFTLSTKSSCDGLVSSSGESLDGLIQRTMKRVCSELDSASSSVRTQAFTLMIWVRVALFSACLLLIVCSISFQRLLSN